MSRKKIVYMDLDMGAGHRMTKQAIMEAVSVHLRDKYDQFDVNDQKTVNPKGTKDLHRLVVTKVPFVWGFYYKMTDITNAYEVLNYVPAMRKDFKRILEKYDPDAIVITISVLDKMLIPVIKKLKKKIPVVVMVTDTGRIHKMWVNKEVDHYLVATKETEAFLVSRGVEEKRVHFFGFPLRQSFYKKYSKEDELEKLGLDPKKKTVLFLGGGLGMGKLYERISNLDKAMDGIQIIVVCGKNEKLRMKVEETKYKNTVVCLGFHSEMARVIAASDIAVTKAGGVSIMELVTMKKPIVVTDILPGHEPPNARFVEENGFGVVCKRPGEIGHKIRKIFDTGKISQFEENLKSYTANDKSDVLVAEFIDEILEKE